MILGWSGSEGLSGPGNTGLVSYSNIRKISVRCLLLMCVYFADDAVYCVDCVVHS
jgi:hypothetical protein